MTHARRNPRRAAERPHQLFLFLFSKISTQRWDRMPLFDRKLYRGESYSFVFPFHAIAAIGVERHDHHTHGRMRHGDCVRKKEQRQGIYTKNEEIPKRREELSGRARFSAWRSNFQAHIDVAAFIVRALNDRQASVTRPCRLEPSSM